MANEATEREDILTDVRVEKVFLECLASESDNESDKLKIDGIVHDEIPHRAHLYAHTDEIFAMLLELPPEFMVSGQGKGYSFLGACLDKNGRQWTGQHLLMEELMLMGIAIEKVKILLPRKCWGIFPGGMPYFAVLDQ